MNPCFAQQPSLCMYVLTSAFILSFRRFSIAHCLRFAISSSVGPLIEIWKMCSLFTESDEKHL